MTNEELSAKVAEVRGDKLCDIKDLIHTRPDGTRVALHPYMEEFTPKPYATDLNHAWGLVEDMKAHDNTELVEINLYKNEVIVQVRFKEINPTYGRFIQAEGSNPPEAVCNLYLESKSCN